MTIDQELQAALDVEPSPEFVASLRRRIATELAPGGSTWSSWWIAGACGFAAAAVVAAAVFVAQPTTGVNQESRSLLAARALPSIAVPAVPHGRTPIAPRSGAARLIERKSDGELILIDPRETAALRRLIAGAGSFQIAEAPWLRPSPFSVAEPASAANLDIPDIVIEPLPIGSEGARK